MTATNIRQGLVASFGRAYLPSVAMNAVPAICLALLTLATASAETTSPPTLYAPRSQGVVARNLSESFMLTQDPANKEYFASEMNGEDPPGYDGNLKPGEPHYAEILNALMTKDMEPRDPEAFQVGLIKSSISPDAYLAWVYVPTQFTKEREIYARLSLGIVHFSESAPTRIEFSAEPIRELQFAERERIGSFVARPYDLGALGKTWGIRIYKDGCGAGGSICATTFLKLLSVQNGKLTIVFDDAISYYGNYGGDWNKNGTRQHIVEENPGMLTVGNDLIDAIPVLILKAHNGKLPAKRRFQPTKVGESQYAYRSTDPEIIQRVD